MRVVIMLTVCYLMAGMAYRAQVVAAERLVSQAQPADASTSVVVTGSILVLPAVRTRASLARSSIVIHVGIPAGQIRSLPVIRFIPGLIRTPARPSMALDHRVAM